MGSPLRALDRRRYLERLRSRGNGAEYAKPVGCVSFVSPKAKGYLRSDEEIEEHVPAAPSFRCDHTMTIDNQELRLYALCI